MNREKAKELLPIIQAYAEGKTIQEKHVGSRAVNWSDLYTGEELNVDDEYWEFRIKPESEYRPFKDCDELIMTWYKIFDYFPTDTTLDKFTLPCIWVRHKIDGRKRMIVGFGSDFVEVGVKAKPVTMQMLYEHYTFLDGSPLGVCE